MGPILICFEQAVGNQNDAVMMWGMSGESRKLAYERGAKMIDGGGRGKRRRKYTRKATRAKPRRIHDDICDEFDFENIAAQTYPV